MSLERLTLAEQQLRFARLNLDRADVASGFERFASVNAALLQMQSATQALLASALEDFPERATLPVAALNSALSLKQLVEILRSLRDFPAPGVLSVLIRLAQDNSSWLSRMYFWSNTLEFTQAHWQQAQERARKKRDQLIASSEFQAPAHWTQLRPSELRQMLETMFALLREAREAQIEF